MDKLLSYKTLLDFIRQQWEQNGKKPSFEIHRNQFVKRFGDISFELINQFLRDLDERYRAVRVKEYAYSEKWEYEKYMNLSAEEIAQKNETELFGKNIEAINRTLLTTSLVVEPNFLDVVTSFEEPWKSKEVEQKVVEDYPVAKLLLRGNDFCLEFEGTLTKLGHFNSKKTKGYQACKSLLEAKGRNLRKDGLTHATLATNTTQLPKLMHIEPVLAKLFYSNTLTHCSLQHKLELNKRDEQVVRNFVNKKKRQKREN